MTLSDLQVAIVQSLGEDAWIAERGVSVVAEDRGDAAAAIDEAVLRAGIVAVVVTPELAVEGHDGAQVAGRVAVRIAIYEEPALNRARAGHCTALQLGERILSLAAGWPNATPERLRQEAAGDSGVAVDVAIAMMIIHTSPA